MSVLQGTKLIGIFNRVLFIQPPVIAGTDNTANISSTVTNIQISNLQVIHAHAATGQRVIGGNRVVTASINVTFRHGRTLDDRAVVDSNVIQIPRPNSNSFTRCCLIIGNLIAIQIQGDIVFHNYKCGTVSSNIAIQNILSVCSIKIHRSRQMSAGDMYGVGNIAVLLDKDSCPGA